jgi:fructose-1,6-bisphosphatase/inositol monophosphatase family enzyme
MPSVHPLTRTALEAAEAAAAVHRRDAGQVGIESATEKSRADYVSRTDVDAQAAALEVIGSRYPDHTDIRSTPLRWRSPWTAGHSPARW